MPNMPAFALIKKFLITNKRHIVGVIHLLTICNNSKQKHASCSLEKT